MCRWILGEIHRNSTENSTCLFILNSLYQQLIIQHSGGEKQVTGTRNILSQNNCSRIPRAPQVTVIGSGRFENHEGISELDLKHLYQSSFHEDPLSPEDIANDLTQPYRWHMDAALYATSPRCCHIAPYHRHPPQQLHFPESRTMSVAAGATLFFSSARNFEGLSDKDKDFDVNTTVQYAPLPYEYMHNYKASADRPSIHKTGREQVLHTLLDWTWDEVQSDPSGKNPSNGQPHTQIAGCCVYSLTTTNPETGHKSLISNLQEVRDICHRLQMPVYSPESVYAHAWQRGGLVLLHNRGVMHSVSGKISRYGEGRLLWQCNLASGTAPSAWKN
ncbi:Clavaminate synthase-like protein [Pseudovirgaria hyperparasitica]|uniref:Clavaminate synthase-like protein n=1 Tax=Pseudovirgaria hyperparasitica TaxID=470096 RepID=A0A6A6W4E2_9PEZI|nr:Clavaminate synthase-like protein [Pseudovirgaria hyperparasitica]KAF2757425.1 Clavaminate synthase-like protein [Pseudovirgaria hyperparasitica]